MQKILEFIKKYVWLTAGLALALVLLLAAGGRLFFVYKSHKKEKQELNGSKSRLDGLYQRAVFPSAANIAREKEKLDDLIDEFNELRGWMAGEQVEQDPMEAAEFMTFFENTLRRIRERLQTGRVAFPDKYAFGFEKYAGGMLPAPDDIPRLVQQVKITERLCQILPDAALSQLVSISRDEFESAADKAAPAAARGRGPAAPAPAKTPAAGGDALHSRQHFKLAFRATEGSVLDLLNRLARLPMFTVVTRVEITNPRKETSVGPGGWQQGAGKDGAAGKLPAEETSRDKRIVLGREELEAVLEMDVYNFGPPIDFKEDRKSKGTKAAGS